MTNIECTPGSSALVLMVANPVTNATGPPGGVAPSMNSTVPPGMPVPGATVITDDWSGYAKLGERGYCHTAVAERGDMQVAETFLPIIHLVFSNLKTWLRGIHHGVSPQHLQAYLNEFTFRFNRRFYPFNAFRSLLGIAGDVTAPTYAELYTKKSRPTTTSSYLGS